MGHSEIPSTFPPALTLHWALSSTWCSQRVSFLRGHLCHLEIFGLWVLWEPELWLMVASCILSALLPCLPSGERREGVWSHQDSSFILLSPCKGHSPSLAFVADL